MKKGFTLIELLAVIVILAIIALIATPIILNVIGDSREEATERSIENYMKAVKLSVARENLSSEFNPDVCEIQSNGYILCHGKELKVEVDGNAPNEGWVLISKGKIEQYSIKISDIIKSKDETGKITTDSEIKEKPIIRDIIEAVINPTINGASVGITPEVDSNGNLKSGSTFNIMVNNQDTDGSIFYVLSNDGDYVNLIAQQNITSTGEFTSEPQNNDQWYVTSRDNRYGPQTAYTYLSTATAENWTNIPVIESFNYLDEGNQLNSSYGYKGITTTYDSETGKYITTITTRSGNPVTYQNMRARLPYISEITENTSCTTSTSSCPLWMINYLSSSNYYLTEEGKVNSTERNSGYWMLPAYSGSKDLGRAMEISGYIGQSYTNGSDYGVRPVITISKSVLLEAMK